VGSVSGARIWPSGVGEVHVLLLPRLYFSSAIADDPGRPLHATWEIDARAGGRTHTLKTTRDGTSIASNPSGFGVISDVCNYQARYTLPSAVVLAGQVRAQNRLKARSGIGIGPQGHQSQLVIRVYTAAHALKGTPLAPHEPGTIDSKKWSNEDEGANPPIRNAKFPAGSRWTDQFGAVLTPVSCDAGDYILVEFGGRAIEEDSNGPAAMGTNTGWSSIPGADLPAYDEVSVDDLAGWIEFWQ
jgi:hypothetical protein